MNDPLKQNLTEILDHYDAEREAMKPKIAKLLAGQPPHNAKKLRKKKVIKSLADLSLPENIS